MPESDKYFQTGCSLLAVIILLSYFMIYLYCQLYCTNSLFILAYRIKLLAELLNVEPKVLLKINLQKMQLHDHYNNSIEIEMACFLIIIKVL
jgi:hypothetical protein